jgi:hypothetical protein
MNDQRAKGVEAASLHASYESYFGKRKPTLFDWLTGDNKPDALGYRRCDPQRARLVMQIMRDADKERGPTIRNKRR